MTRPVQFDARMARNAYGYIKNDVLRALPFVTGRVLRSMLKAAAFDGAKLLDDEVHATPAALYDFELLIVAEFKKHHPTVDVE